MRHLHHRLLTAAAVIVATAFVFAYTLRVNAPTTTEPAPQSPSPQHSAQPVSSKEQPAPNTGTGTPAATPAFSLPLTDALSRITKKAFGLYVTPKNSPVQPERFSGYHCGTDFETTPEEKDADVPVRAACDGTLARKKTASGYGGVAVQRCKLGTQDITVIYGHLRLASITANVGDMLTHGQRIGLLGTGYSEETDGERKHLHLGVHKGRDISIKGYVQTKSELDGWIDALTLLR